MNLGAVLRLNKLPVLGIVPEKSATAPASPVTGQLWTDTSVTPNLVKAWDGTIWSALQLYAGTGASNYAAGNDTRLSDFRTPIDASVTGGAAGAGVKIAATTITVANLAASLTDGTAASLQVRALGTTATTAAAGNDARLSDQRVPTDGSVTGGAAAGAGVKIAGATVTDFNVAAANKDGVAGTPSLRTIGTGAQQAMAGNTTLSSIAAPTANVGLAGFRLTNVGASVSATDVVIRSELDSARQGFAGAKDPVRVAVNTNVNLASPGAALDSVTLTTGDRFLAYAQSTALDNGIYVFNGAASAATRALDADALGEIKDGTTVAVGEGTFQGSIFIETATLTAAPGTAGGTQTWVVFNTGGTTYSGTANRVTVTGSIIDISSAYVGQASITTLGTITTGVWTGTAIAVANGGTGATTAAQARTNLGASGPGFAATLGAVTAGTAYVVTHNLNTQDVIAQVRDASTNEYIFLDVINASTTTVTITSGIAFAANALRIVVLPVA